MSDRIDISIGQVEALIRAQFPQWSHLPVRPVPHSGWDNRSFRLGDTMLVRLPSAERYVAQVAKEQLWLPRLAPHLPLPIPQPLVQGMPDAGYPWIWSIYGWLEGEPLATRMDTDLGVLAQDVAHFLRALEAIDTTDGPVAGAHNFHRGGSLRVYDAEARAAMTALSDEIDVSLTQEIWDYALVSHWQAKPVWVHGDIAEGNLLVKDGRLCAVIDFGSAGVGDPASDLILAWNVLDRESRAIFRSALPFDAATWQRGRGWALWKAMITLAGQDDRANSQAEWSRRTIREVFEDHLCDGAGGATSN